MLLFLLAQNYKCKSGLGKRSKFVMSARFHMSVTMLADIEEAGYSTRIQSSFSCRVSIVTYSNLDDISINKIRNREENSVNAML
jgi:hypothetical protein